MTKATLVNDSSRQAVQGVQGQGWGGGVPGWFPAWSFGVIRGA